jgi:hypothetical protein
MAQRLSHHIQFGAFLDHVGGKGMSKGVNPGARDPSVIEILGHNILNGPRPDTDAKLGDEQTIALRVATNRQVSPQCLTDLPVQRDCPVLYAPSRGRARSRHDHLRD